MAKHEITPRKGPEIERVPGVEETIQLGQWYWVKHSLEGDGKGGEEEADEDDSPANEWFGCVTGFGSNYVKISAPPADRYTLSSSSRIHLDEFHDWCRLEPDPEAVLRGFVEKYQNRVAATAEKIQHLLQRIGAFRLPQREGESSSPSEPQHQLALLNAETSVEGYQQFLATAKEETVPQLKEQMEADSFQLSRWLQARTLPAQAMAGRLGDALDVIKGQIFNVNLYAGFAEDIAQIRRGKPAPATEKLHVMQRRLYMDEESLVAYEVGGMEFGDLRTFEKWLSRKANMERILPFPRTLVAFRVRRHTKRRDTPDIRTAWINLWKEKEDKYTYLYIRNGGQLFRMYTDIEFDARIFPNKSEFNATPPLMAERGFGGGFTGKLISMDHYEELVAEFKELERKCKEWAEANPGVSWVHNPYNGAWHGADAPEHHYARFSPESVLYDDIVATIAKQIEYYNRIVLIIQGLFDRTEVFHPHPPVQTWTPEGFDAAITLVYDADRTLHNGAAPDFEAYRQQLNESLGEGFVTMGQQWYWRVEQGKKKRNTWGNPGPGEVARIMEWKPRSRKATYRWLRRRQSWSSDPWSPSGPVKTLVTVPADALVNLDAYIPGDFRQFFQDPRTREKYLQWAPILLTAEEYKAGNVKVVENQLDPRRCEDEW